jgi:hypothetical protein
MDNTSSSIQPQLGWVSDPHAFNTKKGAWGFMLNGNIESLDGDGIPIPTNEQSNFLHNLFPIGYLVIGQQYIKQLQKAIFMLVNPITNKSQIGEINISEQFYADVTDRIVGGDCINCGPYQTLEPNPLEKQTSIEIGTYNTIVDQDCLGFNINYPIDIEYQLTNCDFRIYWTDYLNQRRFLYMDIIDGRLKPQKEFYIAIGFDAACNAPIFGSELDCNKILVQPKIARGMGIVADILAGGRAQAGTYQFFICYADVYGNPLSEYFPGTNQIPIKSREVVIQDDYLTDKGILLNIVGLDYSSYYRYYNIAVIKRVNSTRSYYRVTIQPIGSRSFFFTDNIQDYVILSEVDLNKRPAYYHSASFVTSSNGILFWGGMKEFPRGNWQRLANMLVLNWQTCQIPLGGFEDPKIVEKYRGYTRDEVYFFGLVIEFDNGEETDVLHIPGPPLTANDTIPINASDNFPIEGCTNQDNNERWKAYNTAKVVIAPHQAFDACQDRVWEWGTFGYWESSQSYPDNELIWGELRCQKIRGFKMPDSIISPLYDGLNGNNPFERRVMIYPIGVRMDHNTFYSAIRSALGSGFITQEMVSRITGYRIVRADRNGNETIAAKGYTYDCLSYDKDGRKYHFPNYPFNDTRPDPFISNISETYKTADSNIDPFHNPFINTGRYTFHSPETHFRNPDPGVEFKVEAVAYGDSVGYFNECLDHPKYKFMSFFSYLMAMAVGIATQKAKDSQSCHVLVKKGTTQHSTLQTTVGALAGLTGGAITLLTIGDPVTNLDIQLPANSNPINAGSINDFNGPSPVDLQSSEEHRTQCTGRLRDHLFSTAGLIQYPLNPWRYGGLVGPAKSDVNVFGTTIGILFGTLGFGGLLGPRVLWDFVGTFIEIDKFLTTMEVLVPNRNMAYQYQAIGRYNNFMPVPEGKIRRRLLDFAYIRPQKLSISEKDSSGASQTIYFNNHNRESSLFLKIDGTLDTSSSYKLDGSRFTSVGAGTCDEPTRRVKSPISSFYVSLKTGRLDPYGSVYDINYLETGHISFKFFGLNPNPEIEFDYTTIYGGDTFICEFSIKRKHQFFSQNAFGLPNNADWKYSEVGNAGYPNFYFDSKQPLGERLTQGQTVIEILFTEQGIKDILGVPRNRYDCDTTNLFWQGGKIYLFSFGIPLWICESTINTDYRTARDTLAGDFYPRQQDLDFWLQNKNVPFNEDNQYHYNPDYSSQAGLSKIGPQSPVYVPNKECAIENNNDIVFTGQQGDSNFVSPDRWLQNLAADRYQFPLSDGRMISAEGIENNKVLVRFEHNMRIFNAYVTINTSNSTAAISTGNMFQSPPIEFSKTDIGHLGTKHKIILNTEFGHITVDAQRGSIYILAPGGGEVEEITKYGNRNWFQQNLPFTLKKYFPEISDFYFDNAYKGLGLTIGYDKRFKRLFITKHDYKPLRKDIEFRNGDFYVVKKILVNKSYTRLICPNGWVLNGNVCERRTLVPAQPSGSSEVLNLVARQAIEYAALGAVVYSSFNPNGTGVFTQIPWTNPYWLNSPQDTTRGPGNRAGIWNNTGDAPYYTWVGVTVPINVPEAGIYYIGMLADNIGRIRVGCTDLMLMDPEAMAINHNMYVFGTIPNTQVTFTKYHIYPVQLNAGITYLEIAGLNESSIAVFACEIYKNTYEELFNARADEDLTIIFSTRTLRGQTITNLQYECLNCEALIEEGGDYFCVTDEQATPTSETVNYTEEGEELIKVPLWDKKSFCNMSWTAAFRLDLKLWLGHYSFKPNYYLGYDRFFQTGVNTIPSVSLKSSLWSHLLTEKSYQVFFGVLQPFEIEPISEVKSDFTILESIQFKSEYWRYHNEYDKYLKQDLTFNKVMVFTDRQCTGILHLEVPDRRLAKRYPIVNSDGSGITTNVEIIQGQWTFNFIRDFTFGQYTNVPFLIYNCGNWKRELNIRAINYNKPAILQGTFRSEQYRIRFINDKYSNYKILLHWINFFTSQSRL